MSNKKELTSGRLQDIEATLGILKRTKHQTAKSVLMLGVVPYLYLRGLNYEEWIRILEFERKQEKESLIFWDNILKNRGK